MTKNDIKFLDVIFQLWKDNLITHKEAKEIYEKYVDDAPNFNYWIIGHSKYRDSIKSLVEYDDTQPTVSKETFQLSEAECERIRKKCQKHPKDQVQ